MKKGAIFISLIIILFLGPGPVSGAEKLKFATSIRISPWFYLPALAGEEGGIWRQNGLDVEWVPFAASTAHYHGIASGAINIGTVVGLDIMEMASRGIPIMVVAQSFTGKNQFGIWVRADSHIKKPEDLPGAKLAVTRLGGASHAYGRIALKALGLEGKVRFVGSGGVPQQMAALIAGTVEGLVLSPFTMLELKVKGQARDLLSVDDYLPEEWVAVVIYARKDFIRGNEAQVSSLVKAIVQAVDYIRKEPNWAMERMKKINAYSDATAKTLYGVVSLTLTKDGKINKKGLENVRSFAIDYELVIKEKTPPVEELYTDRFTR